MTVAGARTVAPDAPTPGRVSSGVVICAYTELRWEQLLTAVDSVLAQEPAPDEVVVVVDHNDALLARLTAVVDARVVVVANRHAKGLSGARNTGVEALSAEVVLFLDDDARAEPGWLAEHVRHYADPGVVGVGGTVVPVWEAGRPPWFPEEFGWVTGCSYTGLPDEVRPIRNPIGANMSFLRQPVSDVGGFRDGLGRIGTVPLGCEETELAIRVVAGRPAPAAVLHSPGAVARHSVPASRGRFDYFVKRCWAEGLSKAQVARLAGAQEGLRAERSYVTRTLPAGVARNLRQAVRDRSVWSLARAAVIPTGLAVTTSGFVVGRVRALLQRGRTPVR